MVGKHQQSSHAAPRRRRSSAGYVALLLALVAVVVIGTIRLTRQPSTHDAAAPIVGTSCSGSGAPVTLVVDVAPALALPVNEITGAWAQTKPKQGGRCIDVELDTDTVDEQEQRLATLSGSNTDVWLPDSSTWAQRLIADEAAVGGTAKITRYPGLASSPLVAVTSPARAAKLQATSIQPGFDPLRTATIADPLLNAEGTLALLQRYGQSVVTPNPALVATVVSLSHSSLSLVSDGYGALSADPTRAPVFVASEQSVVTANTDHGSVFATAVYPTKQNLSLDFPVVGVSRTADDPALAGAATQFIRALRTTSAKARLAALGFRASDGTPTPTAGPGEGVTAGFVPALQAPTSDQAVGLIRLWNAATSDGNTLTVIDVSGSMAESAGNGQSKIAVAAAAAENAVSFYPDTSSLGLWVFSSDQTAATPWVQLVPLGLLGDRVGATTRRQALIAAARTMPARVRGGTALYDTVYAAYRQVQSSYDPSKVNSVVLLTDGQNDLPGGQTLTGVLAALKKAADPQRPVAVLTIGIGAADESALGQLSAATGGNSYVVHDPADIRGIFLDAIAQRRCKPSC